MTSQIRRFAFLSLFLLALLALLAIPLSAQIPAGFVQTTGTVSALANGTYGAAWTNLSSSPQLPLLGGVSPFQQTVNGKLDSNGHFAVLLADTAQIIPMPSTWMFTFTLSCPTGSTGGPGGFMVAVPVTGGGGTEDITAQITAAFPSNPCGGGSGSVVPGTVGCTPTYISSTSLGGCAGTTMTNVMTAGCKVDGATDDTACWNTVAANLSGKTWYLPAGTGCSIINGFINIGSPTYLPGSFRIIGAGKGALGSCIQQNTSGMGVFQFVRELTNSFDIEYINFTALAAGTPVAESADTNSTAILFNPTTHTNGGEFNFNISNNTFGNFARGIGVQKQVASVAVHNPVWGFNIDNNIAFGSLGGALFNLTQGAATGNPRCAFHGNYASNTNTTEPQFSEATCQAFEFTDNESNNANGEVADFSGNSGTITDFHIEQNTVTVSGTPIIAMENSEIVTTDIDFGSHVCPALNCGTNPIVYLLSNIAGGGMVNAEDLYYTQYSDSTPGAISDVARVGTNTINTASRIGAAFSFTNLLQPGDASNLLFAQVGAVYNITSQVAGFYKTNQATPQQILVTTAGTPQGQLQFGSGAVGPGLVYYSSLGDGSHWKPGTIEMGNDGKFHFTNGAQITAIPAGAGAYPTVADFGALGPNGLSLTAASCIAGAFAKGDGTGCGGGIANVTISIASFAIPANTCYGSTGSTTPATVTQTGVLTTSRVAPGFTSSPAAITGWGTAGGLNLVVWPSAANTDSYLVCNSTSGSITGGAITLVLGAQ